MRSDKVCLISFKLLFNLDGIYIEFLTDFRRAAFPAALGTFKRKGFSFKIGSAIATLKLRFHALDIHFGTFANRAFGDDIKIHLDTFTDKAGVVANHKVHGFHFMRTGFCGVVFRNFDNLLGYGIFMHRSHRTSD